MKKRKSSDQVEYQGRWVPKEHFRVFVYNKSGERLVNSYEEYQEALASGLWFSTQDNVPSFKLKKVKADGSDS